MEYINSLDLVKRHDGSYFYIKELGREKSLYKYAIADWQGNSLGKPLIFYSHAKRSKLSKVAKEFFDNNLINPQRLKRYLKNNLYIGGINRINNRLVREIKEEIKIKPNYKQYIRDTNYIIVELIKTSQINKYNLYEFINRKTIVDFEQSSIFTEKDLLNLNTDEENYVINKMLSKKRVSEKIENENGYVGTVEKINGKYRKISKKIFK